jgi:MFS family permease
MSLKQTIGLRYPALASRDFTIFWVGQFISLIGTWMQSVTQPYLAFRLSGNPFDLGVIGFAATLPTLFLALPGGVLVERFDKRKTVIVMQVIMLAQAFIMAFLTLTGVIQIWHIAVLAFFLGAASAIEITARQSMLIELVGKEALPNAIALQSTIYNAARVIGPSLAAPFLILIQGSGEGWAFFANGVSYLFIIISLFFVSTPFKAELQVVGRNWLADFREGQVYIRKTRSVLMIVFMVAVLGFIAFPLLSQIPVIASDVLAQKLDTDAIRAARNSALYTAQGVGALIAAFWLASFNLKNKGKLLMAGLVIFILAMTAIGGTHDISVEVLIFILIGWGSVTAMASMNTLIQLQVPDSLRGRVFSTYLWAQQGIAPFGSLLVGWMVLEWGMPVSALVTGLICLVLIGGINLFYPDIWNSTL